MESQFPFLVVDIGTNGEILLWKENDIIGTSCAAGPAFEGKNLSRKITGSMAINFTSKFKIPLKSRGYSATSISKGRNPRWNRNFNIRNKAKYQ